MQPPARRPDVSLYRLGTDLVFFDRAQSMDPQARKTKCRLNTLLTPNPSCECQGRGRRPTPPSSRRQLADPCNKATPGGNRQLFGAVANAGTDIVALIRRTRDTMGRTSDTELTAFTDGCSSMRSIRAEAGFRAPPILDWFHLSMRLQHAKQAARGLPADGPDRAQARAAIAAEVERLRWRTWNGKAKDARITLERIHALLPSFEG